MATHQQEVVTPVAAHDKLQSPTTANVDYDHYQYQNPADSTFRVDVAPNDNKEALEKGGKPLKKFLWWRITKKQRIFAILGIVVVILVVLILIAWFVIVKAVFQHNVNKIKMTVNYLDINNISDQTTLSSNFSLHMKHDLSMNAKSDATTASLIYDGTTFAEFEFPALTIDKGGQEYDLDFTADLIVTDPDVFKSMSSEVMDMTSVVLDTSAEVKAHALGFSYGGLDFKRELTFEGFNNFRDPLTVIQHIDFWGCTDEGWIMDIDVNVTNISQMGLDGIGYLNLTLYVDDLYLGYLSGLTPEGGVPRGVSTQSFRLFVDIDNRSSMVNMVRKLIDGYVNWFITGESDYATDYTLFKDALSVMNMSIIYTEVMERIDMNASHGANRTLSSISPFPLDVTTPKPFSVAPRFASTNVVGETEVDVDPDVGLDVTEIVEARGYTVETHKVTTADRYVLTMHRLPETYDESQSNSDPAANKPVVLLQHGLVDSSFTFVCNFRNQSLAFMLADAGYDVWLANNRGNTWSREHLDYTDDDDEFWDFSWEDMGKYDLPAEIEYVLNTTEQLTLSFVGHSEGNMQAFARFSTDQKLAQKVSYFAALAPVAWTGHLATKVFNGMAKLHLEKLFQAFGIVEFSAKNKFIQETVGGFTCTLTPELCDSTLSLIMSAPSASINTTRFSVYLSQMPAGTSVKNMAHFAQGIRHNTFASYDYGCKCDRDSDIDKCPESKCKNKKMYSSFDPPAFPIGDMVYPRTGLYIGAADSISTETDIEQLRSALPSGTVVHELTVDAYTHLDITWAYDANEKMYQDLLVQLKTYRGVGYTVVGSSSRSSAESAISTEEAGEEADIVPKSKSSFQTQLN
ncbi:hypothetical protein BBO99_00008691 [Phytophthora kernoviae]|uniref:Partial AB-hydrolase lipase domain-containing protein n=1 Tax=Phytophthora kernoviae TaxID=325452 RepID=A0A3R7IIH3_9STRA|nr:hypothetical protein JM18_008462 [Phytophthora kernoviae]RLN20275.1 hypothetical protein BBI17_008680 [Phytophthora kernoviae]RLN74883.1 hypothetical protein BBO99_00008691 [Phytophthora kernoviae]